MAATFDATSNSGACNSVSTTSWSHVCTGSQLALVVSVDIEDNTTTISTCTYNSVAVPQLGRTVGTFASGETRGLTAPSTGSNTVSITLSASTSWVAGAVSATLVDQSTSFGTYAGGSSATSPLVNTITSGVGYFVVSGLAHNSDVPLPSSDKTSRWGVGTASADSGNGATAAGAASSTAVSWSWTGSINSVTHGVAMKGIATGGAPFPPFDQRLNLVRF